MIHFFLHTDSRVRIISGEQEFECTPARFVELEPDYPGLCGGVARYWTPERSYIEGAENDGHDCGQYCQRIAIYTQYPVIYADVTLSKIEICGCDPQDFITFDAILKDATGNTLPLDYIWNIRLSHETQGDVDRIRLAFVQGLCSSVYTFPGVFFGEWFLDESKFDLVDFGGQMYQVRLVSPVRFTVYREVL